MKKIILASKSPRRKELLKKIVDDYEIEASNKEEKVPFFVRKRNYSKYLAILKAKDVFKSHKDSIVIGSDTIVLVDNIILGKPKDYEDARRMMHLLSGKTHEVITGVCIISSNYFKAFKDISKVTFKKLSEEEIDEYCKIESIYDKAGAYAIQEDAGKYVTKVEGDYDTIVGLPTIRLKQEFNKIKDE